MAELLKDIYNEHFIDRFAQQIKAEHPGFPVERFKELVHAEGWESLALKQRMRRITESLSATLPPDYRDALDILLRSSVDCRGLEYMLYPDFVELRGLDDPEASVPALAAFTKYSSSEFAVRPFIRKYPSLLLEQLKAWAADPNEHVRRLASEGCRPRLPWAMALNEFKTNPAPILELLELLKEDVSEYVRRSVANNLNDISKDHPRLVLSIARRWYGHHPHTDWIVRHGCRTLLKRCDPEVLRFFGFVADERISVNGLVLSAEQLCIGDTFTASFRLINGGDTRTLLRIEYAVDFVKANGSRSRKLFKLSEKEYPPGEIEVKLRHSFAQLTTRKHYPGEHGLAIIVNGEQMADTSFVLKPQTSC
ncbi:DNA alkylation repair protein [Paenibacillus hemerocallicola]|uniref:DNA alkylation repair protein n=1 Tax=Paenibacillus hemerocallicola TaxID=1172614 RepID=A0A5C4T327_9BACL|nr:DNA alkylation repair protein [Paenibacillus hemerocallicola]TNJ63205.1 DNA alkylation repair protein [Paenibacillus hemerocallicola]